MESPISILVLYRYRIWTAMMLRIAENVDRVKIVRSKRASSCRALTSHSGCASTVVSPPDYVLVVLIPTESVSNHLFVSMSDATFSTSSLPRIRTNAVDSPGSTRQLREHLSQITMYPDRARLPPLVFSRQSEGTSGESGATLCWSGLINDVSLGGSQSYRRPAAAFFVRPA